jgi:hypothetical protein
LLGVVAVDALGGSPRTGWLGLGAGVWPGADWRPYSATSPFNMLIGKATPNPRSDQLVQGALQWGPPANLVAGEADTAYDYGHPVYYATRADPVYVLHPTEDWGSSSIAGRPIPVPVGARPAGGSDGHMTIVTPDGWEYDLWRAQAPSAGRLTFAWGGRVRIDGSGLGSDATAAHFGSMAGLVRPEELAAGHIDHALFIVLKCTGTGTSFGYGVHQTRGTGTGSYVYPASAGGSSCDHGEEDPPPLGARFQLAMSRAQIAALHAPRWKLAILNALARYGGYVGDTGGAGFAIMLQSGSTYTSFGVPDRLVQLAHRLGITSQGGRYVFDLASGVDWRHALRIVSPPVARHAHRSTR